MVAPRLRAQAWCDGQVPRQVADCCSKQATACSGKAGAAGCRGAKHDQQGFDGSWLAVIAGDLASQGGDDAGWRQVQLVEQERVLADDIQCERADRAVWEVA